jgi:hypothetical protein
MAEGSIEGGRLHTVMQEAVASREGLLHPHRPGDQYLSVVCGGSEPAVQSAMQLAM